MTIERTDSMHPIRIAIMGPESTGKTVLAEQLSRYFKGDWVKEFARDHLTALKRPYTLEDVLYFKQEQRASEDTALDAAKGPVFFDTDSTINFDIWMELKFGISCRTESEPEAPRYDFYLLTFPDIPFEPDALRENPHRRDYLFNRYLEAVVKSGIPYHVVKGSGHARLEDAVEATKKWMSRLTAL